MYEVTKVATSYASLTQGPAVVLLFQIGTGAHYNSKIFMLKQIFALFEYNFFLQSPLTCFLNNKSLRPAVWIPLRPAAWIPLRPAAWIPLRPAA